MVHLGVVEGPGCQSCGEDKESIVHAYWRCPKIKQFLSELRAIHLKEVSFPISLTEKNVILICNSLLPVTVLSMIAKKHIM